MEEPNREPSIPFADHLKAYRIWIEVCKQFCAVPHLKPRQPTIAARFRQMQAIFALVRRMDWHRRQPTERELAEDEEARARWRKFREAYAKRGPQQSPTVSRGRNGIEADCPITIVLPDRDESIR
jgi:hypothetical protein